MIHTYIGDGKGKTTAALGLALRAAGCGKRIYIAQFLKDKKFPCSEMNAIKKYLKTMTIERFDHQVHPMFAKGRVVDVRKIKNSVIKALRKVERYVIKKEFDMIILDEILNAVSAGFCNEDVLKRLMSKVDTCELVLTGRSASMEIITKSDYVSIIKKCKHPYDTNKLAREGIEY